MHDYRPDAEDETVDTVAVSGAASLVSDVDDWAESAVVVESPLPNRCLAISCCRSRTS